MSGVLDSEQPCVHCWLQLAQRGWGRHPSLRSKLWGTEDCGRHRGSWEAERIMGGTEGLREAQKAEIKAGGTEDYGRHRGIGGGTEG